jgi:hypothetical protein
MTMPRTATSLYTILLSHYKNWLHLSRNQIRKRETDEEMNGENWIEGFYIKDTFI